MSKRTIGIFFIVSIIMDLIGAGLLVGGLVGSTFTTTNNGYSTTGQVTTFGNLPTIYYRRDHSFSVGDSVPDCLDWRSDQSCPLATMGLVCSHVNL